MEDNVPESGEVARAARDYLKRGFAPVPVPALSKAPVLRGWPKYSAAPGNVARDFPPGSNLGLLLGEPSDGLVDVDLDDPIARSLADVFLPATEMESGRKSSPRSHRWYRAPGVRTQQYSDPVTGTMLVELRSTGHQTLAPPSTHPSGEELVWTLPGAPRAIDPSDMAKGVAELAASTLIARHWPGRGERHGAALAWSGVLLGRGIPLDDATALLCNAAQAAGDEEWRSRGTEVRSTAQRLESGGATTGLPTLEALGIDVRVVRAALVWLGLGQPVGEVDSVHTPETWPPLQELRRLAPVPALDGNHVPEALRPWLVDVAERLCVPLEMVAAPALVTVGTLVGRRLGIRPKQQDDWLVIPNVWGAVVGRPGVMKSAAISKATRPLNRLAARAAEEHQRDLINAEARLLTLEEKLKVAKAEARRSAKEGISIEASEEVIRGLLEEIDSARQGARERRYMTQDATPEKLGELLRDNPHGVLLLRDELAGWLRTLDREGRQGERELFLEGWNGDSSFTFDRIGRGTVRIESLCLSVLGGIQPGKLSRHIEDAVAGRADDDGLLQRVQLVVWPDVTGEWRNVDRGPDSDARERALDVFEAIDKHDLGSLGAIEKYATTPYLRFNATAQRVFDEWRADLEVRLRSEDLERAPAFTAHLAKYRSLMPALALLFELLEAAREGFVGFAGEVGEGSAIRAAEWIEFLESHARRLYDAELDPGRIAAHKLAARIEAGDLEDGTSVRDLVRRGWGALSGDEIVRAGLRELEERGWLRVDRIPSGPQGGRPSHVIRLRPDLKVHRALRKRPAKPTKPPTGRAEAIVSARLELGEWEEL